MNEEHSHERGFNCLWYFAVACMYHPVFGYSSNSKRQRIWLALSNCLLNNFVLPPFSSLCGELNQQLFHKLIHLRVSDNFRFTDCKSNTNKRKIGNANGNIKAKQTFFWRSNFIGVIAFECWISAEKLNEYFNAVVRELSDESAIELYEKFRHSISVEKCCFCHELSKVGCFKLNLVRCTN